MEAYFQIKVRETLEYFKIIHKAKRKNKEAFSNQSPLLKAHFFKIIKIKWLSKTKVAFLITINLPYLINHPNNKINLVLKHKQLDHCLIINYQLFLQINQLLECSQSQLLVDRDHYFRDKTNKAIKFYRIILKTNCFKIINHNSSNKTYFKSQVNLLYHYLIIHKIYKVGQAY